MICIKPTKTLTKNKEYFGTPVKKERGSYSYNSAYTGKWKECSEEQCTSYKVEDDIGIDRYISKKRFKL